MKVPLRTSGETNTQGMGGNPLLNRMETIPVTAPPVRVRTASYFDRITAPNSSDFPVLTESFPNPFRFEVSN